MRAHGSPLKRLAEVLAAPVATSLQGKSAFPEDHPLSLGSGGSRFRAPFCIFLRRRIGFLARVAAITETAFGHCHACGKEVRSCHA